MYNLSIIPSSLTYNFTVDWGDGNSETITTSTDFSHTYAVAGTHTVTIAGTFPSIKFNNGGDKTKIIEIPSLGNVGNQGISVDISFDGKTIAVGSTTDYNSRGCVHVYEDNETSFVSASDPLVGSAATSNSMQGNSVSLNNNGNILFT